ncbi:hypothetical protein KFK09_011770 [Dendrobium nobile]|uniref:Uncharacterized protein n=1 Tax=Dendrobium nobile TaxID=94219 RepID=A0A8T3BDT9_DENNO|nr:hypothetical protein KFK09_011770 [Dendrobium nobile]
MKSCNKPILVQNTNQFLPALVSHLMIAGTSLFKLNKSSHMQGLHSLSIS